jgi:putative aminopeptidase FrvX
MWLDYVKPFTDSFFYGSYGTAVGVINPTAPFKVVIEAHADEIKLVCKLYYCRGLIYLKKKRRCRSPDSTIHEGLDPWKEGAGKSGFWLAAIHTRMGNGDKETQPKVENLFLDCGARTKKGGGSPGYSYWRCSNL